MKNKELFDRTIGILVRAFQNDTLRHEEPCGCAIGNLIAGNNGYSINTKGPMFSWHKNGNRVVEFWNEVQVYGRGMSGPNRDIGIDQLLSTGYNLHETLLIEGSFESTRHINEDENGDNGDADGFLGLMALCDALMQIHEATTEEVQDAKDLFVRA